MDKFSRWQIDNIFYFSPKLDFDISSLHEKLKCKSLISRKSKKKYFKMWSAEFFTQHAKY